MKKFISIIESNFKWIALCLLGLLFLFKIIVTVGTMANNGTAGSILVNLIELLIVGGVLTLAIFALLTKRDSELRAMAKGFTIYFVVNKSLNFSSLVNQYSGSGDALVTSYLVFTVLADLLILGIFILYLLGLFVPSFKWLSKFILLIFLTYFVLEIVCFALNMAINAKVQNTWYSYFSTISQYIVLPIALFFMYFYASEKSLLDAVSDVLGKKETPTSEKPSEPVNELEVKPETEVEPVDEPKVE